MSLDLECDLEWIGSQVQAISITADNGLELVDAYLDEFLGVGARRIKERRAIATRHGSATALSEFSIEHSGFVHENPMTAIGAVLISSVVLGTTDVDRLAEFTRYSKRFIRVISANMENSRLWKDGHYDCAGWSSANLLPCNEQEDSEFWDHIRIAEGSAWTPDANSLASEGRCHNLSV